MNIPLFTGLFQKDAGEMKKKNLSYRKLQESVWVQEQVWIDNSKSIKSMIHQGLKRLIKTAILQSNLQRAEQQDKL